MSSEPVASPRRSEQVGPATETSDAPPPLEVRVTRSKRRRKTAEARLINGVIDLRIPAACTQAEEAEFIEHFRHRFERSRQAATIDLDQRARRLAREHGLPVPTSIRWVSNQNQRWGSCTPADGTIRLSNRMAGYPLWVIDYVVLHELVHLVEVNHTARFHQLVDSFPKAERAKGYLQAKADGL